MSFVLFSSLEPRLPTLWYSEHPASITQGRFTVNNALIYFQLGHKDWDVPAGKHLVGRIRWMLVVSVPLLRWDSVAMRAEWPLLTPEPRKCTSHLKRCSTANPADSKAILDVYPLFFFGILMTQRFPLPTVFLRSTRSLIENIFPLPSAPGRQRSGTARGQPPWSDDGFRILLKGTLSLPDAHWHDSLNKVERYFQVWKSTPVENDAFCLSKFRLWFDYFLSLYHVYHPALRVKVQPLIKLLQY